MSRWVDDPILIVDHLTMRFGGLVAVNDLSFAVGRGDITAVIGPNGAGKTTVFNCITGFYKPTQGRIAMLQDARTRGGIDAVTASSRPRSADHTVYLLERMADFEIARRARVARTFQNIRLFGGMTVLENLMVAQHNALMTASGLTGLAVFGLGLPRIHTAVAHGRESYDWPHRRLLFGGYRAAERAAIERARFWLDRIGLTGRANDAAQDLPYGAQRRLEIARAMCADPLLLCLDEPAAGLNPRESNELNELLLFIRDEQETSLLLIEHDMSVVMEISDHVVVLDYGEKISDGPAEAVRNDPAVIAAYLGVDDEAEAEAIVEGVKT